MVAFTNRFEIKYQVESARKPELRRALGGFFDFDPNGDAGGTYVNYSIYFDSPYYRFYGEKREGELVRIKPRIRVYKPTPSAAPAAIYLELKARYDRIVDKRRVEIDADLAKRLLSPGPLCLTTRELEDSVLAEFNYLSDRFALGPVVTVVYFRTAFNGRYQHDLRMTFDEEIRCSMSTRLDIPPESLLEVMPPTHFVLELKYNDHISELLLHKFRCLGLEQNTLSKYALTMEKSHDQMRAGLLTAS